MVEDKKHGFRNWQDYHDAKTAVSHWRIAQISIYTTVGVIAYVFLMIIAWQLALLGLSAMAMVGVFYGLRLLWRKERKMRDLKRRVKEYDKTNGM